MLTEKQLKLFNDIVPKDFDLESICGKKVVDTLDTIDFNKILQKLKSINLASQKQLDYIKLLIQKSKLTENEIQEKFDFDLKKDTTREKADLVLTFLKKNIGIDDTLNVNIDISNYSIIKQTFDYIICNQQKNQYTMKLIIFKHLMVIDWDNKELSEIELLLSKLPYTFWIYKTFNGYHGYCMSNYFDYYKNDTLKLMKELNCDLMYISFVKKI
jgi:hypothetical protein